MKPIRESAANTDATLAAILRPCLKVAAMAAASSGADSGGKRRHDGGGLRNVVGGNGRLRAGDAARLGRHAATDKIEFGLLLGRAEARDLIFGPQPADVAAASSLARSLFRATRRARMSSSARSAGQP